jgi:N-acetylmuramoyl-L-alanine amidase
VAPVADGPLTYGEDGEGRYGEYRIRRGEALYSAVVVRFTNYKENEDVLDAVKVIQQRSGIVDVRDIDTGMAIRIPEEMLSARYKRPDSPDRRDYEAVVAESARLRQAVPREIHARDLEGIVVVLDPGHGSRDVGKQNPGRRLFEDEINYDIMCRAKIILERDTRAKVYVTMLDKSSGYKTFDKKRFSSDNDEVVLTTPRYPRRPEDYDSKVSANLRFYLANDIYDREIKNGHDSRKIVFTSFHIDSLHQKLRGAMIYIPGAKARSRRPGSDHSGSATYKPYKEVRPVQTTAAERRRDEALSRAFAETLYDSLGKKRVQRHKVGPAIRSEIRQRGNKIYVPAVIRGNKIPTKILLEAANMNNRTDRQRMADPEWRQMVAEAYVDALKTHYGTS